MFDSLHLIVSHLFYFSDIKQYLYDLFSDVSEKFYSVPDNSLLNSKYYFPLLYSVLHWYVYLHFTSLINMVSTVQDLGCGSKE